MLVQDFLHASAARLPDKVALVCDGRRLTYGQVDAMADRLANALIEHGVRRNDRVAIYLDNSVEAAVSIFAILKAGAAFLLVNRSTKRDKLAHILNNCGARALIAEERGDGQHAVAHALAETPSLQVVVLCGKHGQGARERYLDYDDIQRRYPAQRPPNANIDLDLACLLYTSGSTGEPKGVMSDHGNVSFVCDSIIAYLENTADDVILNVLPLSFGYGMYQWLMTCRFGGTLVLERSFAFPAAILQRMEHERATGFPGVPTIYAVLLQMDLGPYDLSSLRYYTNAAAPLAVSQVEALRQKLPQALFYSMYGLTETARTLYMPPDQLDARPGSVGIAIPGTEVWLVDERGERVGPGEVGELVARGRHVMRGYWEDPAGSAERFKPGPLPGERICYTGDLFRADEAGYMYFVSRKDDIIKSRGEKVPPKEVEGVLYALPGVIEAAVVGAPDPLLGQVIKAFVVFSGPALSEAAVLAHCRAHLEDFMVPRTVEFRDALPKTSSGKIRKIELQ